ncbi:hypothetical protein GCM10027614_52570 [Micromonospora vulcania]
MSTPGLRTVDPARHTSWRSRRLDPDHSLGLRLTLAASAAFLVLVPFALLALLVLGAWAPLHRLDGAITDVLHGYAVDHPVWVTLMRVWSEVFAPLPLRAVALLVVIWLLRREPADWHSGRPPPWWWVGCSVRCSSCSSAGIDRICSTRWPGRPVTRSPRGTR